MIVNWFLQPKLCCHKIMLIFNRPSVVVNFLLLAVFWELEKLFFQFVRFLCSLASSAPLPSFTVQVLQHSPDFFGIGIEVDYQISNIWKELGYKTSLKFWISLWAKLSHQSHEPSLILMQPSCPLLFCFHSTHPTSKPITWSFQQWGMCFKFARARSCMRRGFDIPILAVVLHNIMYFQWPSKGLFIISVTWRDHAIVNNFNLAHVHSIWHAMNLNIFARLRVYALCATCQLQCGRKACRQSKWNDQKFTRCCLSNSIFALKLVTLHRCIESEGKDAILLPMFYILDLYVNKLLDDELWCAVCKPLEVDIMKLLGCYVRRTYVQNKYVHLCFFILHINYWHWICNWWSKIAVFLERLSSDDVVLEPQLMGLGGRAPKGSIGAKLPSVVWERSHQRRFGGGAQQGSEVKAPNLNLFTIFPIFSHFYFICFVPLLACLESFEANLGHWSEFCTFTK